MHLRDKEREAMDISEILTFTKEQGASDLHISSGEPPVIRIHGEIQKVDMPALSQEDVHKMLYDILNDQQLKTFERDKEIDFALDLKGIARSLSELFSRWDIEAWL